MVFIITRVYVLFGRCNVDFVALLLTHRPVPSNVPLFDVLMMVHNGQIIIITTTTIHDNEIMIITNDGYPANSHHDKIPPWWEYVIKR